MLHTLAEVHSIVARYRIPAWWPWAEVQRVIACARDGMIITIDRSVDTPQWIASRPIDNGVR